MSVEPQHKRVDPQEVLVQALREAGVIVLGEVGPSLDPTQEPVTVLQTPNPRPMGPLTRWVFWVNVTLVTYAESAGQARATHYQASDALLGLTDVLGESIRVSAVTCTQEPSPIGSADTPQWPGVVSLYSLTLRRT